MLSAAGTSAIVGRSLLSAFANGRVDGGATAIRRLLVSLKWAQLFLLHGPAWTLGGSIHVNGLGDLSRELHHLEPQINAVGDFFLVLGYIFERTTVVEPQMRNPFRMMSLVNC